MNRRQKMVFPKTLSYTKTHEWIEEQGDKLRIGLTDYAQAELGDLVFVNLPEVGDGMTAGEPFADVESVKAVSDVFAPATGTVAAVNEALLDDPAAINANCYEAWLVEIEGASDREEMLTAEAYEALLAAEG
jgi:glycine cleavage system H protein